MSQLEEHYEHLLIGEFYAKCKICGDDFIPSRGDQMYCSSRCKSKAWRERNYKYTYLNCVVCGKSFRRIQSHQKYCSKKCANIARKRQRRNGKGKGWANGLVFVEHEPNVVCDYCGTKFFKRLCYLKRNHKRHFCSNKCRTSYIGDNKKMYPRKSRRSRVGKRADIGIFVRSAWEANYARYLNWLIEIGEIKEWEYEPDTFEFENIKRGTRFYTPDFKITNLDDSIEYHEVKGYMDKKSATQLKRMKKYHPSVKVILVDKDAYYAIRHDVAGFIPNWE